jgi:hypothetical protein
MMSKLAATLLTAIAMAAAAPLMVAPTAHATVCAAYRGPRLAAGGCTDALGHAVLLVPAYAGQPPCYTPDGQAYWTPDGDPC